MTSGSRGSLVIVGVALGLVACARARTSTEHAAEAPAAQQPAYPASVAGQPGQSPQGYPQPSAPATEPPKADSMTPTPQPSAAAPPPPSAPAGSYATPPNRSAAMSQATGEIEASQRELDVAGGDCRNACRALGSMDRAAGRLCGLAQSNDEVRRCGDAKTKVYSARDKVRNTCGTCPDVSVERNAPIPSK